MMWRPVLSCGFSVERRWAGLGRRNAETAVAATLGRVGATAVGSVRGVSCRVSRKGLVGGSVTFLTCLIERMAVHRLMGTTRIHTDAATLVVQLYSVSFG